MLNTIGFHSAARRRLAGLACGITLGVLLQKAGVTHYTVIISQLLLVDFTAVKLVLSAMVTGMLAIHLSGRGLTPLQRGSFGATAVGGIIFGAGLALLGYSPATVVGAVGQGSMDALAGGATGIIFGCWLFAALQPGLARFRSSGEFSLVTLPQAVHLHSWQAITLLAALIVLSLLGLEWLGF